MSVSTSVLVPDRLTQSHRVVRSLIATARAYAARDADDCALALARMAATVARRRHAGMFADEELESVLVTLSSRLTLKAAISSQASDQAARRGSLLHVATTCHPSGGHSRLVERWIRAQPETRSDLVLTDPDGATPSAGLLAAVSRSGGVLHQLHGTPMQRASRLRELAAARGFVTLSAHENDVVPMVALAAMSDRPPVIVVNHADHVFWVGARLADVVACLRPAGADLAWQRRGVSRSLCIQLAVPVAEVRRTRGRGEARDELGIPRSARVLATVGWRYKYAAVAGRDLVWALGPILEDPEVHLIAVGPRPSDEPWASAITRYGPRIHAVGPRSDAHAYIEAADVFLDSFPIPSFTASLEAGMLGLPIVGLRVDVPSWPATLTQDGAALAPCLRSDVDSYREHVVQLLSSEALAQVEGSAVRALISELHGAPAWQESVRRVQSAALQNASARESREWRPASSPQGGDVVMATYVADAEDWVMRPEMRFTPVQAQDDSGLAEKVNAAMECVDALLLGNVAPRQSEYEAALRAVRAVSPSRREAGVLRSALVSMSRHR